MEKDPTDEFAEQYRGLGLAGAPSAEEDVQELEGALGVKLPAAYRGFLRVMGKAPDDFFLGTDVPLAETLNLQAAAVNLLDENGNPFALPPNAFVFVMHQGYQFMYFVCEDSDDDPLVLYYLEGMSAPEKKFQKFSEWVTLCA